MASLADELAAVAFNDFDEDVEALEEEEDQENDSGCANKVASPSARHVKTGVTATSAAAEDLKAEDSLWCQIVDQFDPDEETANFGTRHAFEAPGNLFDVFTLATIQPRDKVTKNPNVLSRVHSSGEGHSQQTALALDRCLHVLAPEESAANGK